MALYESVFLARQDISPAQVDALIERATEIVTAGGGTVAKKEYWGLRNLTFRIKKNRKAHYVLLNLNAPAAAVQELERNLGINEDVLRYITVRVESLEEGPSAMMRRDRDDRGEFGGRDRGFGGRDRGFGGRDRGFGGRDRGFGGRDRGFGGGDRGPRGGDQEPSPAPEGEST